MGRDPRDEDLDAGRKRLRQRSLTSRYHRPAERRVEVITLGNAGEPLGRGRKGTMARLVKRLPVLLCVLGVLSPLGPTGAPMAAALEVGEAAPDFALPSTTGEKMSLSQFRGKKLVLLEFYGADFSPV